MKKFPMILARSSVLAFGGLLALSLAMNRVPELLVGDVQAAEQGPTICEIGRDFAASAAKLRDMGVPRSDLLDEVKTSKSPAKAKQMIREIIDTVYDAPELTPEIAGRALYDGCMNGLRKAAAAPRARGSV